jgi:hypothetical protein
VQTEDPYRYERLLTGDPTVQRDFLRLLQAFAIALLILHVSVAASVMPYVYVDDLMANCGARMVLNRFGSDVWFILVLLAAARAFVPLYRWILPFFLRPSEFGEKVFFIFGFISGLFILVVFGIYGVVTYNDLTFLSSPTVILRNSAAVCPDVEWKPKVEGNTAPAPTKSTGLVVGITPPRSVIDLPDVGGELKYEVPVSARIRQEQPRVQPRGKRPRVAH